VWQRQALEAPGSAHLEFPAGVVHLRPEDATVEAMLRGWRAQQLGRGLREDSITDRELLVRRFLAFTNELRGSGRQRMWMSGPCRWWRSGSWPAIDGAGLPRDPAAVHRVSDRRPVRVGTGVRAGVRHVPDGDLP
jgi:hypothetical protein